MVNVRIAAFALVLYSGAAPALGCDCGPGVFSLIHADSTTTQIALAWQPISGASGYVLERADSCTDIGTAQATEYVLGTAPVFGDTGHSPDDKLRFHAKPPESCVLPNSSCTGLSAVETYHYRIRVLGTGQVSNCVSAQLATQPPADRNAAGPNGDGSQDLWADFAMGQPDLGQNSFATTDDRSVEWSSAVLIDTLQSPDRVFIADANHNRVLGFSSLGQCDGGTLCSADSDCPVAEVCTIDPVPDVLLGQPSYFDVSACNGDGTGQVYPYVGPATASSLCLIDPWQISVGETVSNTQLAVDTAGSLYLPDIFNHRVVVYDDPFSADAIADEVLGQATFTGNLCNRGQSQPSADSLCLGKLGSGVALDSEGNLWVADSGNFRVLRFPKQGAGLSQTADVVLGQASFVTRTAPQSINDLSRAANEIAYARDVAVDVASGAVYVADDGGSINPPSSRILVFEPDGNGDFANGMSATQVLAPSGTCVGGSSPGVACVLDSECGGGVCEIAPDDPFRCSSTAIDFVDLGGGAGGLLRQGNCPESFSVDRMTSLIDLSTGLAVYEIVDVIPSGMSFDSYGNLFVLGRWGEGLYRYLATDLPSSNPPQNPVFSGDHHADAVSADSMLGPRGAVVFGDQLVVADSHRVLIWNSHDVTDVDALRLPGSTGTRSPDDLWGEPDFETQSFAALFGYPQVFGGQLWVSNGLQGNRLMVFDPPLRGSQWPVPGEQSVPVHELDLTDAANGFPVLGDSSGRDVCAQASGQVDFVVTPAGDAVWVADRWRSRVFRIVDWDSAPYVDVVIGQSELTCGPCNLDLCPTPGVLDDVFAHCNRGDVLEPEADTLCIPYGVNLDAGGNLYVVDNGSETGSNRRILRFDAAMFPSTSSPPAQAMFAPLPSQVLGTGGDYGVLGSEGADPLLSPFKPAFDGNGAMVFGNNPYSTQRLPIVFLDPSTDPLPQLVLGDFTSYPDGSPHFDSQGNLYFADPNWARVLVYKDPLGGLALPPGPTAAPTSTPTPTFTSTFTPTPTPTATLTPTLHCQTNQYGAAVLGDAPVGYWRLGEATGAVAANEVGPDATYVGSHSLGVSGVPNETDTAVHFTGGFVGAGNDPSIDIVRPLTLEAWIYPTALRAGSMHIIGKADGSVPAANYGLDLFNQSTARFYTASGTNYDVALWSYPFADNNWYHLVATQDVTGRVVLWINGESQAPVQLAPSAMAASLPLGIGTLEGGSPVATFPGRLDEVAIYDYVLPDARAVAHYWAGTCSLFTPTPTATYTATATYTFTPTDTATPVNTPTSTSTSTPTEPVGCQ